MVSMMLATQKGQVRPLVCPQNDDVSSAPMRVLSATGISTLILRQRVIALFADKVSIMESNNAVLIKIWVVGHGNKTYLAVQRYPGADSQVLSTPLSVKPIAATLSP
jgi:hypothetical protein